LERALPLREYRAIGIPRRPYVNRLDQLNSVREKYLIAGKQYPLAEMNSHRDFGQNIARTEPPSLLFSWSDNGETIVEKLGIPLSSGFRLLDLKFKVLDETI
jgi:hypothetical protein